jgi:hypothetical protein
MKANASLRLGDADGDKERFVEFDANTATVEICFPNADPDTSSIKVPIGTFIATMTGFLAMAAEMEAGERTQSIRERIEDGALPRRGRFRL